MELVPRKAMTMVSSLQDTSSFVSCSILKHTSVFWIHHRTMLTMGEAGTTKTAQSPCMLRGVAHRYCIMPNKYHRARSPLMHGIMRTLS